MSSNLAGGIHCFNSYGFSSSSAWGAGVHEVFVETAIVRFLIEQRSKGTKAKRSKEQKNRNFIFESYLLGGRWIILGVRYGMGLIVF